MKLDATDLRYITADEFRVLTAVSPPARDCERGVLTHIGKVEMGSKNHEIVPTVLVVQISGLRNGGVNKIMGSLAKRNLVAKVQNAKYDGYRLTYGGYDYLAMRALSKRDSMYSVGNQIGVGKESDIYIVADAEGNEMVLKLHRLGRISFRAIKEKRDYLGKRKSASWMYMSRLAAQKEWAFMKASNTFSGRISSINEVPSPGKLYSELMDIIVRFAHAGLIHGDYNEFNIMIHRKTGVPVVIDFPQMVSTSHENAEWYFNRDVECIRTFFRRRFGYESALYPKFQKTLSDGAEKEQGEGFRLDVVVAASGFSRKEAQILEEYMEAVGDGRPQGSDESDESEEEEEEADEDEDESEEGDEELQEGHTDPEANKAPGETQMARADSEGRNVETTDESALHPSDLVSPSLHGRELSRSPPQSRSPSPDSLAKMTESLSISASQRGIKDIVSSDLTKQRARQRQKHHSKRGAQRVGRAQGSKAKQDNRVKMDKSGFWD
ncbi:hypothetical protein HWV62_36264 [Athelia sp. TMB]|nr:hypothetical protein HWV62_36264 [Athelia sp. TMB]